jgi:hypothetical protein
MARRVDKVLLGQEGNPRQGRMTSHRTIFSTLALIGALVLSMASSASANSLLSGYGGPGEGNQAILGSALVGGASGGGGSGGGSSGGSSGSSTGAGGGAGTPEVGNATPTTGSGKRGAGGTPGADRSASGGTSGARGGSREAPGGSAVAAARARAVLAQNRVSQPASGGSVASSLSGEDLGYVLLACAALALIGVATKRLTQAPQDRPEVSSG